MISQYWNQYLLYLLYPFVFPLWKYVLNDIAGFCIAVMGLLHICRFSVEYLFKPAVPDQKPPKENNAPITPESTDSEDVSLQTPKSEEVHAACKQKGLPDIVVAFYDSFWRSWYYTISLTYSSQVLWRKPWMWNIEKSWTDFELQAVTLDIWAYYMVTFSFYLYLFINRFIFRKRKYYWEIFNYALNVAFISLSWYLNFIRIGSLILFFHDLSDALLDLIKVLHYTNHNFVSVSLFGLFLTLWISIKLGYYPFKIIRHILLDDIKPLDGFVYYLFNSILIAFLILHFYRTYLIVKFTQNSMMKYVNGKDVRDLIKGGFVEEI